MDLCRKLWNTTPISASVPGTKRSAHELGGLPALQSSFVWLTTTWAWNMSS
jgi:hypothetical protein